MKKFIKELFNFKKEKRKKPTNEEFVFYIVTDQNTSRLYKSTITKEQDSQTND